MGIIVCRNANNNSSIYSRRMKSKEVNKNFFSFFSFLNTPTSHPKISMDALHSTFFFFFFFFDHDFIVRSSVNNHPPYYMVSSAERPAADFPPLFLRPVVSLESFGEFLTFVPVQSSVG